MGVSVAAAAAGLVAGLLVAAGSRETATASAATVLHRAASVAQVRPIRALRPGEFLYTKSVNTYLDTYAFKKDVVLSALVPGIRESWLGPTGGALHQTTGAPRFLSARDRATWIALGRPKLGEPAMDVPLPSTHPLDLPSDPDALYATLEHDEAGYGPRKYSEMFVVVGDDLRESTATPAQRAALYDVAARIPGVELLGTVKDSIGRSGVAVALDDRVNKERQVLVFDPQTSSLLAEEDVVLDGNSLGYPAGTRIGQATYVTTAVVDKLRARPIG